MRNLFAHFHFNTKLLILTIPPMLIILYLTLSSVVEEYKEYTSFSNVEESVLKVEKISKHIHELQKERGLSSAYISSKGTKFEKELLLQQIKVNEIGKIKDLYKMRKKIMNLKISVDEQIAYYSKHISLYFEEIAKILKKRDNSWLAHKLIAYKTFLLYKENVGIERALGMNLLVSKNFDYKRYKKFIFILANQKANLRSFKIYANEDGINFFYKKIKDKSFKDVIEMENAILESDKSKYFVGDATLWFSTITKKIDILKEIEDHLSKIIFNRMKERKERIYNDIMVLIIIDIFMFFGLIPMMLFVSKKLYQYNKSETKILLQQSKMATIGEMLGAIAHQWRQPLNVVGVLAQEIEMKFQMGILTLEELKKLNNQLLDNLDYMSTTIDDFKNFYKPDKKKKVFDVEVAINESLQLISTQLKVHNIQIEITHESKLKDKKTNLYLVNGFEGEFKQVIINILQNAKDAILLNEKNIANKKISIKIIRTKVNLEIKIKDNGGGIKQDSLESIFDIYVSTKDTQQGTGLGLYMSKLIIEQNMQGKIKASNKDDGAEFSISLHPEEI